MNAIESLKINSISEHEREIIVTLASSLVSTEYDITLNNWQKQASRPGFRKGQIPKNMMMSFFGPEIRQKLVERLIDKSFNEACAKEDLVPVSQPQMEVISELESRKPFTYKAIFQVKPKVTINKYSGLSLKIKKLSVSESTVEAELKALQESHATFAEPSNRDQIAEFDLVQASSQVKIDGEINPAYHEPNNSVPMFANNVPNNLKEALLGKKVGETVSVDYTMPDDHQDEVLRGKACELIFSINSIKERILPNLDDDFAKDLSDKFTNLEELKESIRLRLSISAKRRNDYYRKEAITKELVEQNPINVPEALVQKMAMFLIEAKIKDLPEKSAKYIVQNHWQELWNGVQEHALFRVKSELLCEKLIDDLKIEIDQAKVQSLMKKDDKLDKSSVIYNLQMEKLLDLIEKEAQVSTEMEPMFAEG